VTLSKPFGSSVDWAFSTVLIPDRIVDPLFEKVSVVVSGTADENNKNKNKIIKLLFYYNISFSNQY